MSLVNLFRRFAGPLDQLQISYMATGAVAAIVFGEPRLTLDLELLEAFIGERGLQAQWEKARK